MTQRRELKRYIGEVKRSLVCKRHQKRAFLRELQQGVEEYLCSHPSADMASLESVFGTPRQISESFLDADGAAAVKRLRLRRWICAAVAVALLAYLAFIIVSLIDVHREAHGFSREGILCAEPDFEGGGPA